MKPHGAALPRKMHRPLLIAAGILLLLLSACGAGTPTPVNLETPQGTPATAAPSATPTTVPTLTPTPFKSLQNGSGIPQNLPVLSVDNAHRLQVLGAWGNGIAYDMAWSPDGKTIAICTSRTLLLIDADKLTLLKQVETPAPLYHLVFSADSSTIFGGGAQGNIYRYDLAGDGLEALPVSQSSPVTALATAHTQPWLLSANWQNQINLINLNEPISLQNLTNPVNSSQAVGFNADDSKFFTWAPNELIKRWSRSPVKMEQEIYIGLDVNQKSASQLRYSADGSAAVANQEWQVRVQKLSDGTTIGLLKGYPKVARDVDISSDGSYVLTLHTDQVRYWQSAKSRQISQADLSDLSDTPGLVRMSPDGLHFVLLGSNLSLYDINTETHELTYHENLALALAPDLAYSGQFTTQQTLSFALLDGGLQQLDLASGEYSFMPYSGGKTVSANDTANPNLQILSFDDRTIQVVDLTGETQYSAIRGLSNPGIRFALSTATDILAIQTGSQTAGLWQLSTGNYQQKLGWELPIESMQFSSDGNYLVASGLGQTRVYDIAAEQLGDTIQGRFLCTSVYGMLLETSSAGGKQLVWMAFSSGNTLSHFDGSADRAAVNPQGDLLVLAGDQLSVWDMDKQKKLFEIENPARGAVLQFAPDGKSLFLKNADSSVIMLGVLP